MLASELHTTLSHDEVSDWHLVRFWHRADIARLSSNVPLSGVKRTSSGDAEGDIGSPLECDGRYTSRIQKVLTPDCLA